MMPYTNKQLAQALAELGVVEAGKLEAAAAEAEEAIGGYISLYYPELSQSVDLGNWGPVGTPDQVISWLREFREAGVTHFICRFGDMDQYGQVERFAKEVLPAFAKVPTEQERL